MMFELDGVDYYICGEGKVLLSMINCSFTHLSIQSAVFNNNEEYI